MNTLFVLPLTPLEAEVMYTLRDLSSKGSENGWTPVEIRAETGNTDITVEQVANVLHALWEDRIITRIGLKKGDPTFVSSLRYTFKDTQRQTELWEVSNGIDIHNRP